MVNLALCNANCIIFQVVSHNQGPLKVEVTLSKNIRYLLLHTDIDRPLTYWSRSGRKPLAHS